LQSKDEMYKKCARPPAEKYAVVWHPKDSAVTRLSTSVTRDEVTPT